MDTFVEVRQISILGFHPRPLTDPCMELPYSVHIHFTIPELSKLFSCSRGMDLISREGEQLGDKGVRVRGKWCVGGEVGG